MTAAEFFKDEQPEYVAIFEELAKRVGKTLEEIELNDYENQHEWPYSEYEWTEDDENEYKNWLIDHVYKYRKKFGFSHATNKMVKNKFVSHFLLNYSWRYKREIKHRRLK